MVKTMNDIGNRQPDSNTGCSKQKGVKNKQTRQLVLWIGALIVGAVLGIFGISWLDGLMNFIATVYTRLFFTPFCLLQPALLSGCLFPILFIVSTMILNYYFQKAKVLFFFIVNNPTNMVFCNLVIFFGLFLCLYHYFLYLCLLKIIV